MLCVYQAMGQGFHSNAVFLQEFHMKHIHVGGFLCSKHQGASSIFHQIFFFCVCVCASFRTTQIDLSCWTGRPFPSLMGEAFYLSPSVHLDGLK
uniref:Predicted protein n=1 Tax=Hordeum vulgare subsp. vulgare TaxID=112509 RepID=F2D4T3_HORVV|nr:predicted protein [Hordeum vulgare subsp. vulgare]